MKKYTPEALARSRRDEARALTALDRMTQQKKRLKVALRSRFVPVRVKAVEGIDDPELLLTVIIPDWRQNFTFFWLWNEPRLAAIRRLKDPACLVKVLEAELAPDTRKSSRHRAEESAARIVAALAGLPVAYLPAWLERLETHPDKSGLGKPINAIYARYTRPEDLEALLEGHPDRLSKVMDGIQDEDRLLDLARRLQATHPKIWPKVLARSKTPGMVERVALESPVGLEGDKILHRLGGIKDKPDSQAILRIATQAAAPATRASIQAATKDEKVLLELIVAEPDPDRQRDLLKRIHTKTRLKELARQAEFSDLVSTHLLETHWYKHPDTVREFWQDGLISHQDLERHLLEALKKQAASVYLQRLKDLFEPDDQWVKAYKCFQDNRLKASIFHFIPLDNPELDKLIKAVHDPGFAAMLGNGSKVRFRHLVTTLPDTDCQVAVILADHRTGRGYQDHKQSSTDIRDFEWALTQIKDETALACIRAEVARREKADQDEAVAAWEERAAADAIQREAWEIDRKYR